MSSSSEAGLRPAPRTHLLPEMNLRPSEKVSTFTLQLEVQPRHTLPAE